MHDGVHEETSRDAVDVEELNWKMPAGAKILKGIHLLARYLETYSHIEPLDDASGLFRQVVQESVELALQKEKLWSRQ